MKKKTIKFAAFGSVLLLILSVINITYLSNSGDNRVLGLKTVTDSSLVLLQERFFWEGLLTKHPTYLSGWIELTKIEVQLENLKAAKIALEKAREIDPNSIEVKKLSEVLMVN